MCFATSPWSAIKILLDGNRLGGTRYRDDGTVVETLGATHTLVQAHGAWRIATLIGHGPDTVPVIT